MRTFFLNPHRVKRRSPAIVDVYFLVAFGVATVLYIVGIPQNLPFVVETDEPTFVIPALNMVAGKTPNPGWFGNPATTLLYPLAAIYYLLNILFLGGSPLLPEHALVKVFQADPVPFYVFGRWLTVAYGLLSLPLAYLLGRRAFGGRVALLGILFSLTYLSLSAHAQVVRSDSAGAFFALLCVWTAVRYGDRPTRVNCLLASAAVGLAASTRYFEAVFILPLLAVAARRLWRRRRAGEPWWGYLGLLALIPVVAFLVFAASTPYLLLDFTQAMADLAHEARTEHLGADGLSPFGNFLWYWYAGMPLNVGWAHYALAALGTGLAIWRRRFLPGLLAATVALFVAALSLPSLHWQRWLIPVLPLVALLAASGFLSLVDAVAARLRLPPRQAKSLVAAVAMVFLALPLYDAALFLVRQSRPGTRVQAAEWVVQNLPPGTSIAHDQYTVDLNDEYAVHRQKQFSLRRPAFTVAEKGSLEAYRGQGTAYLIVGEEIYRRVFAEPQRYPAEFAFYRDLFTFGPVAEFRPAPVRPGTEDSANLPAGRPGAGGGPTVRIYRILP